MHHPVLGKLTPDENCYLATFCHNWAELSVSVDPVDSDIEHTLKAGEKALLNLGEIEKRARKAASAELLNTYNDYWREFQVSDGNGGWEVVSNPLISSTEFEAQLKLDEVDIIGLGEITLAFDSDLFADHVIEVTSADGAVFRDVTVSLYG